MDDFFAPTAAVQRGRGTGNSGTLLTRHFADNRFDKADAAIFYFQM
jgi:hypothetical protein